MKEAEELYQRLEDGLNSACLVCSNGKYEIVLKHIKEFKELNISQIMSNKEFTNRAYKGFVFNENKEIESNIIICQDKDAPNWEVECNVLGLCYMMIRNRSDCKYLKNVEDLDAFHVIIVPFTYLKVFGESFKTQTQLDKIENANYNGILNERYRNIRYILEIMPNLARDSTILEILDKLLNIKQTINNVDLESLILKFSGNAGKKKSIKNLSIEKDVRLRNDLSILTELSPYLEKYNTKEMLEIIRTIEVLLEDFDYKQLCRGVAEGEYFISENYVWDDTIFERIIIDEGLNISNKNQLIVGKMTWLVSDTAENLSQHFYIKDTNET